MAININTTKLEALYKTTVEFMLTSDMFSNLAKLYYPPIKEACVADVPNHFRCLQCGGAGYKEVESTEDIRLRIYSATNNSFNKKTFTKLGLNIDLVQGEVLTLGYAADMPKIEAANYIMFFSDNTYSKFKFRLATKPIFYGFGRSNFIACFWEKEI